jgi:hypothetical protein
VVDIVAKIPVVRMTATLVSVVKIKTEPSTMAVRLTSTVR